MAELKKPQDSTPYPRDAKSRAAAPPLPDGNFVYVQDQAGVIWILPDGPHRHPRVLGNAQPARYAGDLRVLHGRIRDVTNLSGTFQCDDRDGLLEVAAELRRVGFEVELGAVRFFPQDGSRPEILE